jgi:hypothetical protein
MLDYDRDGKDDIMVTCPTLVGKGIYLNRVFVARSVGTGNFEPFPAGSSPVLTLPIGLDPKEGILIGPVIVFDIDGDSLQDVISCKDKSTIEMRHRLSPPLGFDNPIQLTAPSTPPPFPNQPPVPGLDPLCGSSASKYQTFDIDGDGTPDLVARGPDGWRVLRYIPSFSSSGTSTLSWQQVAFADVGGSGNGDGLSLGDFNGDGLADIWSANGGKAVIWLNAGDGRFWSKNLDRPIIEVPFQNSVVPFGHARTAVLDFNGDGRVDLLEQWEHDGFFPRHVARIPDSRIAIVSAPAA